MPMEKAVRPVQNVSMSLSPKWLSLARQLQTIERLFLSFVRTAAGYRIVILFFIAVPAVVCKPILCLLHMCRRTFLKILRVVLPRDSTSCEISRYSLLFPLFFRQHLYAYRLHSCREQAAGFLWNKTPLRTPPRYLILHRNCQYKQNVPYI